MMWYIISVGLTLLNIAMFFAWRCDVAVANSRLREILHELSGVDGMLPHDKLRINKAINISKRSIF